MTVGATVASLFIGLLLGFCAILSLLYWRYIRLKMRYSEAEQAALLRVYVINTRHMKKAVKNVYKKIEKVKKSIRKEVSLVKQTFHRALSHSLVVVPVEKDTLPSIHAMTISNDVMVFADNLDDGNHNASGGGGSRGGDQIGSDII